MTRIQNTGGKSTVIFPESHLTLKACAKLGRSIYLHDPLKKKIKKSANNNFFARDRK